MGKSLIRLLALMTLSLFFCREGQIPPDAVVVAMDSIPQSLDPRIGTNLSSQKIHQLIFHSLVKKDQDGNIVNDLITDFHFPRPTTLVVTIREGVVFHDGRSLNARDVKYTYDSLVNPDFYSLRKSAFGSLESIEIIDDYRLRFNLDQVDASFYQNLVIGIIPAGWTGRDPKGADVVGSGPFRLLKWQDNRLHFQAFRKNGDNRNNFDSLVVKVISDAVTRGLELQKGSVDIALNNIPFDSLKVLSRTPHLQIVNSRGSRYTYLAFNLQNPALANPDIRKAVAHAINRDEIITYLFHGYAVRAETLLSPGNRYFHKLEDREYRPALSASLLARHGFTRDHPLKLELKLSNSGIGRRLGLILARDLEKVNIDLDLSVREFSAFYNDIKNGNFQLYVLTWVGVSDPDIFYYIFHSEMEPPRGANRGGFASARLDRLTERARRTYNFEERMGIYKQVQELIYRETPYVSLWYEDNLAVLNHRIEGFSLYAFGDFYSLAEIRVADQ